MIDFGIFLEMLNMDDPKDYGLKYAIPESWNLGVTSRQDM